MVDVEARLGIWVKPEFGVIRGTVMGEVPRADRLIGADTDTDFSVLADLKFRAGEHY